MRRDTGVDLVLQRCEIGLRGELVAMLSVLEVLHHTNRYRFSGLVDIGLGGQRLLEDGKLSAFCCGNIIDLRRSGEIAVLAIICHGAGTVLPAAVHIEIDMRGVNDEGLDCIHIRIDQSIEGHGKEPATSIAASDVDFQLGVLARIAIIPSTAGVVDMEIVALLRHGDASQLEPIIAILTSSESEGLEGLLHFIAQLGLGRILRFRRLGDAGFGLLDHGLGSIGARDRRGIQRIEWRWRPFGGLGAFLEFRGHEGGIPSGTHATEEHVLEVGGSCAIEFPRDFMVCPLGSGGIELHSTITIGSIQWSARGADGFLNLDVSVRSIEIYPEPSSGKRFKAEGIHSSGLDRYLITSTIGIIDGIRTGNTSPHEAVAILGVPHVGAASVSSGIDVDQSPIGIINIVWIRLPELLSIQQHITAADLNIVDGINKILFGIGLGDIGPRDRLLESTEILFECGGAISNGGGLFRHLLDIRLELVGLEAECTNGIGMPINFGRLFSHSAFDLFCRLGEFALGRVCGGGSGYIEHILWSRRPCGGLGTTFEFHVREGDRSLDVVQASCQLPRCTIIGVLDWELKVSCSLGVGETFRALN